MATFSRFGKNSLLSELLKRYEMGIIRKKRLKNMKSKATIKGI